MVAVGMEACQVAVGLWGGHVGGGGGLKAVNADDEALQPPRYNGLHCLTAEAQIAFSSLRVHFPHSVQTILMSTPPPNPRVLNLCHHFYYLDTLVNGWGGGLSFVYILLSFIVGDLLFVSHLAFFCANIP